MSLRKLTARFVETVQPDGKRLEVRDAIVRGLELRVSPVGAKVWAFRYRRQSDGAKRTVTLGALTEYSLDDARRWAGDLRSAVARGADPAGERDARKVAETFAEVAAEWLERHGKPNKSPRALQDDRSMLARHILPEIGTMKACEITKRDVIRLLDTVAAKADARPRRDGTARKLTHRPNRVFELVRAIFRWAIGRDLLKLDPTAGVKPPIKREEPRERALSPDEIRTLWAALARAPVSRPAKRQAGDVPMTRATALMLKLALVTAQRIGEVAGMAHAELDLNDTAPVWTVPRERSKNCEPNRVPLSPLAIRLIGEARELAGDAPWLFPNPRRTGPVDPHAPTKALERARPAIGIGDFRVHDLRRTAATGMAEAGINPHTISLVLNHVSATRGTITGRVYNRYTYDREKREALGAWGARLERTLEGAEGRNVVALARPLMQRL